MSSDPPSEPPSEPPSGPGGERGDFNEIIGRHLDYLRARARILTGDPTAAQDLVQNTVLRARLHFAEFTQGTNARAWLIRIMTNGFLDGRKHEGVINRAVPDLVLHYDIERGIECAITLQNIPDTYLYDAIAALEPEQRLLVQRCYLEEKSYREVAELLGVPVGTVGTRLMAARARLKQLLIDMLQKASRS